jgi:ABC-type antimicrobial peptide transport system permease subunit
VRLALGARPGHVVRQVVGGTAGAILAGAAAGTLTAWLVSRTMQRFLFRVAPGSPTIYGAAIVLILGVALLAAWFPARRASRLDPILALRRD